MIKKLLFLSAILGASNISIAQNFWTQKADVGTTGRQSAVGFSVDHMGYLGTGRHIATNSVLHDFWKYDPATDSWTQIADFGGGQVYSATCFVINDTAYVGLGSPGFGYTSAFWKYNQGNNTWSQISDFGGNARYAAEGFAINDKGYVGTG
jgi:N-acetylneuraminic acid mutarotase